MTEDTAYCPYCNDWVHYRVEMVPDTACVNGEWKPYTRFWCYCRECGRPIEVRKLVDEEDKEIFGEEK